MTTAHSPVRTRSQATSAAATETSSLEAVLRELQQLREERRQERQEQRRFRDDVEARLQERDATIRRFEEQLADAQLSRSTNISTGEGASSETRGIDANVNACGDQAIRGFKLTPDTYDGVVPLREFLSQFAMIARANRWNESEKTVVLASCLRGKARSVLDSCADEIESITYEQLKEKLELRFGESELTQDYYLQFTNRKQCPGDDFATLGADLERLSRKAYPECSSEARDKIACSQFVAALTNGFVKRSLQMEGITSLKVAIERAKTLKVINQNSFEEKRNGANFESNRGEASEMREKNREQGKQGGKFKENFKNQERREGRKAKECWKCGAIGHFRSECPTLRGN